MDISATIAHLRAAKIMDLRTAKQAFLDVKETLDQAGIKFWLNSGTALGAVRDKGLIPYDIDV
ncbi:unnamed protein product, partial [marine sediment metagenome]